MRLFPLLTRTLGRFEGRPRGALAAALVAVPLIGALDLASGYELSFSLFYLAPVALAAWFAGGWGTLLVVLCCGVAWLAADLAAGHTYSQLWIPFWNALLRVLIFSMLAYLLRALRMALAAEQILADSDPLTGLANRRFFTERLEEELNRTRRYADPFALAYLDLDHFKQVNDERGHDTGDELLRCVAGTLRAHLRATDTAARLGGDEFAVLLPRADYDAAGQGLEKLRAHLLEAMAARGWPVTFSIGLLSVSDGGGDVRDCLGAVDALMYRVKKGGRDGVLHERF